jgi:hypothetical protein
MLEFFRAVLLTNFISQIVILNLFVYPIYCLLDVYFILPFIFYIFEKMRAILISQWVLFILRTILPSVELSILTRFFFPLKSPAHTPSINFFQV